ncbi:MAG: 50S ribosomal protein L11 methyltransferase [Halieaceae bacterium]|jgi:predicted nicotinamide N-methyase|nr:50S ribosomal protein L11 methyltransferase [Halieaceae bacterium]
MTGDSNATARIVHPGLSARLQQHLPFAEAQCQPLPEEPGLRLYLLNPDFPQHALSAEQMRAVLNYPAYWAFCWASGQVLARFLRERPGWVREARVLDFGSGSGVAGIAAARLGAREVVACDIDPDALAATAANAELNGVHLGLRADFDSCRGHFDLILVADVLYDRDNLPWLDRLAERADRVLVADSRIRDFSHPRYQKLGEWESNTWPDLDESPEFRRVSIYSTR